MAPRNIRLAWGSFKDQEPLAFALQDLVDNVFTGEQICMLGTAQALEQLRPLDAAHALTPLFSSVKPINGHPDAISIFASTGPLTNMPEGNEASDKIGTARHKASFASILTERIRTDLAIDAAVAIISSNSAVQQKHAMRVVLSRSSSGVATDEFTMRDGTC